MSVRATNWAWETGRELDLSQGLRFLLVRIGDHADNDGVCWPGVDGLADYLGCDESTVRRNLKRLEERGLLHRERRRAKRGRGRETDSIHLHMDPVDQPGKTPGRSETTNRALEHGPTGHSAPDQPGTGACPYIEEPSGTVREPTPPMPPQGGDPISISDRRIRVEQGSKRQRDLDAVTAELDRLEREVLAAAVPTGAAEQAWAAALDELRDRLDDGMRRMWIEPLELAGEDAGALVLAGPRPVVAWTERRYLSLITQAVRAASGFEAVRLCAIDREEARVG